MYPYQIEFGNVRQLFNAISYAIQDSGLSQRDVLKHKDEIHLHIVKLEAKDKLTSVELIALTDMYRDMRIIRLYEDYLTIINSKY